jgi:hypothetical protein
MTIPLDPRELVERGADMAGLPGSLDLAEQPHDFLIKMKFRADIDHLGRPDRPGKIDPRLGKPLQERFERIQSLFLDFRWIQRFYQMVNRAKTETPIAFSIVALSANDEGGIFAESRGLGSRQPATESVMRL